MRHTPDPDAVRLTQELAKAVSRLGEGFDYNEIAPKTGGLDRTSVSNIARGRYKANLVSLVRVARGLSAVGVEVEPWQLLVPSIGSLGAKDRATLAEFVRAFIAADPAARAAIEQTAAAARHLREALEEAKSGAK